MSLKNASQILEKAISKFWKDYGRTLSVRGRHTQVKVEPKYIVGNRVNPEVAKRIVMIYLMQMTTDRVVQGELKVDSEGLKIFDKGKQIMQVSDIDVIDNMENKVTCKLGKELSKRHSKEGNIFLEPNDTGIYSFGEIKQALVDFMFDVGKTDSKDLLKDAVMLLFKNSKK